MLKFYLLTLFVVSLPVASVAQAAQPPCSPTASNFGGQGIAVRRTGSGGPYSLTAIITTENTVSDGNTVIGFTTVHQARDSQGRTRVEEPLTCVMDKEQHPHWAGRVTIIDPVSSTRTSWQEGLTGSPKVATVANLPSGAILSEPSFRAEYARAQQLSQASDHAGPIADSGTRFRVEDLGKRNIAGLEAVGWRFAKTFPAGLGSNPLPTTDTEDKWVSENYGVVLLDVKISSVLGKITYQVTEFSPGQPDASLFLPPPGYDVSQRTAAQ